MLKKGAIFGLDARITMLIVALLGLIIFPYFGSVVSLSKAEAIVTTSKNVISGIDSFILDTGSYPATIANLYNVEPTKASQKAKWNGPYLKGHKDDAFVPALNWIVMDTNCTDSSTTGKLCVVRLELKYCGFSESVFDSLEDTIHTHDNIDTVYDSATECITLSHGYNGSNATYLGFRVKEMP